MQVVASICSHYKCYVNHKALKHLILDITCRTAPCSSLTPWKDMIAQKRCELGRFVAMPRAPFDYARDEQGPKYIPVGSEYRGIDSAIEVLPLL